MKNQLTEEQIADLFKFVESKGVRWKDVQFEIVDHLASSVEEIQEKNPEYSFNRALDKVYSKFPITGFVELVSDQEKVVSKIWKKK